jgi:hypothetical protein
MLKVQSQSTKAKGSEMDGLANTVGSNVTAEADMISHVLLCL